MSLVWLVCGVAGLRYRSRSGSPSPPPPGAGRQQSEGDDDSQGKRRRSLLCFNYGLNSTVAYYVLPAVLFVALYSILPHKVPGGRPMPVHCACDGSLALQELRFIFPAIPLLTMGAAVGLDGLLPANSGELLYPLSLLHSSTAADQSVRNRKGVKRWLPPLIIRCVQPHHACRFSALYGC